MRDDRHDRPIGRSNTCVRNQTKLIGWIWEGVVAEGAVTLLSAAEKVGKTMLLSRIIHLNHRGTETQRRQRITHKSGQGGRCTLRGFAASISCCNSLFSVAFSVPLCLCGE
jgi:hypothetical protein